MTVVPPVDGGTVFRLLYRSSSLLPTASRAAELGRLFSQARAHNKAVGVTGALLLDDATFVQVLEGDEGVVRELYETIAADPRHEAVELLETDPDAERVFGRWSMARVSADGSPDIPLIAHVDGIAPAASRGTTSSQESVLARMRQAAAAVSPR
ncbi:MAG: BLUF domain-containing protein [Phycicoccus sp.]